MYRFWRLYYCIGVHGLLLPLQDREIVLGKSFLDLLDWLYEYFIVDFRSLYFCTYNIEEA